MKSDSHNRSRRSADAVNRRAFLAASSTAGVVAALAGPPAVHAAGSDVIKIALVGCGGRGGGAAVNALKVSQNVKLWAMADAFDDRLSQCYDLLTRSQMASASVPEEASARVDVPRERRFVGLEAYKQAIDAVDVVILTGPPGFRPDHTMRRLPVCATARSVTCACCVATGTAARSSNRCRTMA
jgi:myo-inositol 2-dehydrogenase / D-chiro-inositol 1-dehydrogenase